MLNVSNAFKQELYADNRNYVNRSVIILASGTTLNVDNEHIMLNGVAVEDAVGEDSSFTALGSVIINGATLTLYNNDEIYSDYVFENAIVTLYTGLEINGLVEEIRKGTFIVETASYSNATITLNLLDNVSKFDKTYDSTLEYPATLSRVVQTCCNQCGVTLATTNIPNGDYVVQNAPSSTTTYREVMGWCATIAGCFVCANVSGGIEFRWFNTSALTSALDDLDGGEFDSSSPYRTGVALEGGSFNPWNNTSSTDGGEFNADPNVHYISNLYNQNIAVDDIVITGIRALVTVTTIEEIVEEPEEEESEPLTYTYENTETVEYMEGTEGYVITIERNEFLNADSIEDLLSTLGNKLIGLTFRPCDVKHSDDPSIEAGDVGIVFDTKGVAHPILITRVTFNPGQPQTIVCGAESTTKNSAVRFSAVTKAVSDIQEDLNKQKSASELAIERLSVEMANAGGLYCTIVSQPSGGNITYYHNKPELEDSDIQIVISDVGVTVTNDGGTTWYGLTVDGEFIARIMNTIGINFDWGVGGKLIIEDTNGNETFYADADTGVVRIGNYVTFNDLDDLDLSGATWYTGTAITGTSTSNTIFPNSGISFAIVGDMYLNTGSAYKGNIYRCTGEGNASTATWVYVTNLEGEDGEDVSSQYMDFNTTNGLRIYSGNKTVSTYNTSYTQIKSSGIDLVASGTNLAHIGYGSGTNSSGGTSIAPYYTFGERRSGSTIGNYSVAIGGQDLTASNSCSHAEGLGTIASGFCSHAEGHETTAKGSYSHASGEGTIADNNETAVGHYNLDVHSYSKSDGTLVEKLFVVGNGTSTARKDAFSVFSNGEVRINNAAPIVIDTISRSNLTLNGGYVGEIWNGISVQKTGYTAVGIVGLIAFNTIENGYSSAISFYYSRILDNKITVLCRNNISDQAHFSVTAYILFVAEGLI